MTRHLTCREFVEFLDDYLAGVLDAERNAEFALHLAECPSCVAYMKTYRDSVRLGKVALGEADDPAPEDVPEDLIKAILATRSKP